MINGKINEDDEVIWIAPGGDPSTDVGCFFTTHWDTPGEKTVVAINSCGNANFKQVTVAAPTNFRETYRESLPNGELYFEYSWDSASGDLSDLAGCTVGEHVDYPGPNPYIWPLPPWYGSTPNPTHKKGSATTGSGTDTHSSKPFIGPYQAASFSATQLYWWRDCQGNYTTLLGPHSIDRSVSAFPLCLSEWWYEIEKTGAYNATCLP